MEYLVVYGLILNFIGTILLSIPTVDGIKYISVITKPINNYIKKLMNAIIILFILWYILHFFGVDTLIVHLFIRDINEMSFFELSKFFLIPFGVIIFSVTLLAALIKILSWITADKEHQKEKEKRIGALGIVFILSGFLLQIIDTIIKD